jgi:hypothetical protein
MEAIGERIRRNFELATQGRYLEVGEQGETDSHFFL